MIAVLQRLILVALVVAMDCAVPNALAQQGDRETEPLDVDYA